jgi:hypothetical protein
MLKVASWSAHKADLRRMFGHAAVVYENSERRLWFEIDQAPRAQHYVAVAEGVSVCAAWIEMRSDRDSSARDTIKRIVESIGLAPESWPAEEK